MNPNTLKRVEKKIYQISLKLFEVMQSRVNLKEWIDIACGDLKKTLEKKEHELAITQKVIHYELLSALNECGWNKTGNKSKSDYYETVRKTL